MIGEQEYKTNHAYMYTSACIVPTNIPLATEGHIAQSSLNEAGTYTPPPPTDTQ